MIYPDFIKEKDTIGITAPSAGITDEQGLYRLDSAINKFKELGFNIKETKNVRTDTGGKSSSSKIQAKELEKLYLDDNVKAIICASGGEFLLEMLSEVDFSKIKDNPKWLQGYSDPTGLLFMITTNLDIATIYGDNIKNFGMKPLHESLENNIEILKGNLLEQHSFKKYEKERIETTIGDEPYNLDTKVKWRSLNNEKTLEFSGRIIGGCLDLISELFGTRFDNTKEFIEKYKKDGIIWYFDNCEFSSEEVIRTMWRFKDNGWFKYTKGIIFGRNISERSYYEISFKDAIKRSLGELDIPIILDADFGHVPPRMTIINGAIADVKYDNNKGSISFKLK